MLPRAIKISGESRGIFIVGAHSFEAQTAMISMRRVRVRAGVIDALAAPRKAKPFRTTREASVGISSSDRRARV
jgi:hypothetical protein